MVWRRLRIAADTSLAALHFIFQIGVVSRNRRNFRHASSTPATRASRSITLPSL
uniref:plasmid pRiA4b ORF-3 family protein n=1 Tax=Escherichia coli TaxID=562 RepID=UPI0020C197CB|nr:plasmid pRiA4b ORF-3 family protein [Escherichia coli]